MINKFCSFTLLLTFSLSYTITASFAQTFKNPLLPAGADPWSFYKDGYYYYTHTLGSRLALWKTRDLTELKNAQYKVIWNPPAAGPYSREIWAPEIHFLQGKWYIYFAADDGKNDNHRMWVLENNSSDPLSGEWVLKGKITDSSDKWAIDGSVFEHNGRMFMVWSGWEGDKNGRQDIYIAQLKSPWEIQGQRVRLSLPEYEWEKEGDPDVNEGPQILKKGDKLFLIYSASGCWTDEYKLGMLTTSSQSDIMNPTAWKKLQAPVFKKSEPDSVFAPGHNSFFKSPDGTEDWILYHANSKPAEGCGRKRSPRAQKIVWSSDGMPVFGTPVSTMSEIQKPSNSLK